MVTPGSPHPPPSPAALPGRAVQPAPRGDTHSADPVPATVPTFPGSAPTEKRNLGRAGTPMTLGCTNPAPAPRLTSPCWERMEQPSTHLRSARGGCTPFHPKDKGEAPTPLGCRGKEAAKRCWGGGSASSWARVSGGRRGCWGSRSLHGFVSPEADVFPPAHGG